MKTQNAEMEDNTELSWAEGVRAGAMRKKRREERQPASSFQNSTFQKRVYKREGS